MQTSRKDHLPLPGSYATPLDPEGKFFYGQFMMKPLLRRIHAVLSHLGLNVLGLRSITYLPTFFADMIIYKRLSQKSPEAIPLSWKHLFPILQDKHENAGTSKSHYFLMDLYMAKAVLAERPKTHIDIGSRLDGFLAHLLAAGQPVTMIDIRPLDILPENLTFLQDNATSLSTLKSNSIQSISTLHAAEHFGLGRYGDPIDPTAHIAFIKSLARVLAPGGRLYFAVPVGRERVEFNAHRILSPHTLHRVFTEECGLTLVKTSMITTDGILHNGASPLLYDQEAFGCGLYIFTKPKG